MNIACSRRSSVSAADRVLDDLELAGIDGEPIEHDRGEHDPGDREQPVAAP